MNRILGSALLLTVAIVASAAPAPIPNTSTYLGLAKNITLTGQPYSVLGGGMFTGTVQGFETRFWCVDSQIGAGPIPSAVEKGNVIALDQIAANASKVRYGTISDSTIPDPKWSNNLGAAYDTATVRYQMAAYLVSQFDGFNGSVTNNDKSKAIQTAIWAIIHNSVGGDVSGTNNPAGTFGAQSVATWINSAKANYSIVDQHQWAVVSWVVDASGNLLSDDRQTFLVQVVPEPGFYGVLALGLSGLWIMVSRKKKA